MRHARSALAGFQALEHGARAFERAWVREVGDGVQRGFELRRARAAAQGAAGVARELALLAQGREQALMRRRVGDRVVAAKAKEVLQRHFRFATLLERARVTAKKIFRQRASVASRQTLHRYSGSEPLNKKPCESGGRKSAFGALDPIRPNNTLTMT